MPPGTLYIDYTTISRRTEGGTHRPHADNCVIIIMMRRITMWSPVTLLPPLLHWNIHIRIGWLRLRAYCTWMMILMAVNSTLPIIDIMIVSEMELPDGWYILRAVWTICMVHCRYYVRREGRKGSRMMANHLIVWRWPCCGMLLIQNLKSLCRLFEIWHTRSNLCSTMKRRRDQNSNSIQQLIELCVFISRRFGYVSHFWTKCTSRFIGKLIDMEKMATPYTCCSKIIVPCSPWASDWRVKCRWKYTRCCSHTDGRKRQSLQYVLQESVILHGVLDALFTLVSDVKIHKNEMRKFTEDVEMARKTLPARLAWYDESYINILYRYYFTIFSVSGLSNRHLFG